MKPSIKRALLIAVAVLSAAIPLNAVGRTYSLVGGVWNYSESLAYGWPWVFLEYNQWVRQEVPTVHARGEYGAVRAGAWRICWWRREWWGLDARLYLARLLANVLWWVGLGVGVACLVLKVKHGETPAWNWRFSLRLLFFLQALVIVGVGFGDAW